MLARILRAIRWRDASPESLALCIALGCVLGLFPMFGIPTLLCAVATLLLGIDAAAIQIINQLVYPLQLALLVPFVRVGGLLFRAAGLSGMAEHAIAGWFCVALPTGTLLYFALLWLLRRTRQA